MPPASQLVRVLAISLLFCTSRAFASPLFLGDLDQDSQPTILDIVTLVNHLQGDPVLDASLVAFADVDQDGLVTTSDIEALTELVLEQRDTAPLPLTGVRRSSPVAGEGGIAVTRESEIEFSLPLHEGTVLGPENLFASFGGEKILARADLSPNRLKATLFYLEPLPSSARIRVTLKGEGLTDFAGRPLDLDGDGVEGGDFVFDFDTLSVTPVPETAVIGTVYDSDRDEGGNNVPLAGVIIEVVGDEENTRTTTSSDGSFVLQPVPAGRFFVNIDGRPVTGQFPDGDYYPFVGKAWEAQAGRQDNLAGGTGEVFLPCICAETLQPVSPTESTAIGFPEEVLLDNPELADVEIIVPANALFSDDGARGGRVGIAPVPPDRIPEPLPDGLNLPLVITIQTDGASNFAEPVPVRFPNSPDPVTGERLTPGSKSALWSFDHDTGKWEIAGPMTVTDDGLFVVSDPGVGVRQPGWHGQQRGTSGRGNNPLDGGDGPEPDDPNDFLPGNDDDDDGDDDDDDDKNCVKPEGVLKFAWKVVKESLKCAKQFSKIARGIACGVEAAGIAVDLSFYLNNLERELEKEQPDINFLKDYVAAVQALQGRFCDLSDCVAKSGSGSLGPIGLALNIFRCVGNGLSIGNEACNTFFAPECDPPRIVQRICKGIEKLGKLHREIDIVIQGAEAAFAALLGEAVRCESLSIIIDRTLFIIDAFDQPKSRQTGLRISKDSGDPIADARTEALAAIEEVLTISQELVSNEPLLQSFVTSAPGFLRELDEEASTLSSEFQQNASLFGSEKSQTTIHYALEIDDIVSRGKLESLDRLSLILAPETYYSLSVYSPQTGKIGNNVGLTGRNGQDFSFNTILMFSPGPDAPDSDGDGLIDDAEFIVGTFANIPDSDNDGISDGAEVEQGTNPLDGRPVTVGIVASAPVPGEAIDVCAINDIAAVATGTSGIVMFNVGGISPVRIAQVDTQGFARAVACADDFLVVADDDAGLVVIDASDPPAASIVRQVRVGSAVWSVLAAGRVAYAGLANGDVVAVDLESGEVLDRKALGHGIVYDLKFADDALVALSQNRLTLLERRGDSFVILGSVATNGSVVGSAGNRRNRLFVGDGLAYTSNRDGFQVFDISDPANPSLAQTHDTSAFGWKQIVANGSGLGLATTSPNSTPDGPHHVELIDLGDQRTQNTFLTRIETPGRAVAVSIYNGMGYIADSQSGLQVVNYLPFDTAGQPPSIGLSTTFPDNLAEEGKLQRVTAHVSDDVQVRNVKFYLNDELVLTDGNFPFEFRFNAPLITPDMPVFAVRAVATDTGGNTAESDEIVVELTPDATPPKVESTLPSAGGLSGGLRLVSVTFNEPIDFETVTHGSVVLTNAGVDRRLNTADDVVTPGNFGYDEESFTVFVEFPESLDGNLYQLTVQSPLADLPGNALGETFQSIFTVFDFDDSDRDGIPDDLEDRFGFDPNNSDSNGNGIADGAEDADNDGLSNAAEVLAGLDPFIEDTDEDGILDGDEDLDGDGLNFDEELANGTDAFDFDTDGDGFIDRDEIRNGSSPLDPRSRPLRSVMAAGRLQTVPSAAVSARIQARPGTANSASPLQVLPGSAINKRPLELNPHAGALARPSVIVDLTQP